MWHSTQMMIIICILSMRLAHGLGSKYPEAPCDGVEYEYGPGSEFVPAGVCMAAAGLSYMMICGSINTEAMYNTYNNDYCLGNPISNVSLREILRQESADYTITCCSGNQCTYATRASYRVNEGDNCNKTNVLSGINYVTTDICAGWRSNRCENGVITARVFNNSKDPECSGDPEQEQTYINAQCHSTGRLYYEVKCGLTAIDTCQNSTSNPSETTQEPISDMPFSTMFPISDDLDCDHIEIVAENSQFGSYEAYQIPVGYCFQPGIMLECTGYDSAIANTYDNENCLGDPTSSVTAQSFLNFSSIEGDGFVVDLTVTCCTGNTCDIVERKTHNNFDCTQNITGSGDEMFAIIGGCRAEDGNDFRTLESIKYPSCSNGDLVIEMYDGITDCSGDPIITTITNGQCQNGITTFFECVTAIDTCPLNTDENGCSSDKECGFAFICVDGSCIRDCDAFDIEGYLQCSSSFANVQNEIIQINSKISMIDANIANLSIKLNVLDQRSNLNQLAIGEINDEIIVLHIKSNDTNDRIRRFSVYPNVPFYSAQGVVNGPIDNPFEFDNNPKYKTKDILMLGALLINMVIGIYNCIYKDNKGSKAKYKPVIYETGDERDILSEQQVLK